MSIIEDSFGHAYRLHLPDDAPIPVPIEPKEFNDPYQTWRFVSDLRVSSEHWRNVVYLADGKSPQRYMNGNDLRKAVSSLLLQGRIKLYPVDHLAPQSKAHEDARIDTGKGEAYRIIHASKLLVNPHHDVMQFHEHQDAERFLKSNNISAEHADALLATLPQSPLDKQQNTNGHAALVNALLAGKLAIVKEKPELGASAEGAGSSAKAEAPAQTKSATLGPHTAGGGAAAPAESAKASKDVASSDSKGVPPESKCTTEGEPISMTSGEELLSLDDFALAGPIPFIWKRTYRTSTSATDNGLGYGWVHPGPATLTLHATTVELLSDDGRSVSFKRPQIGSKSLQLHENMTLVYETTERFLLVQPGQPTKVFDRFNTVQFRLSQWRHKAYAAESAQGFVLDFNYDNNGRLQRVNGNWGRGLMIERATQGRIAAIYQTAHNGEKLEPALASYDYDHAGNLIAHRNAAGHGETYQYSNHVITQRTLASGYAFYFEWDRLDAQAKCLRQAGEHGNYAYEFKWTPENRRSEATNSLGYTTRYRYNQFGLITERVDAEGHAHLKEYNEAGQVISQIDPLGNRSEFLYDEKQRVLRATNALGQRTLHSYSGDELSSIIDAAGQRWVREVNAQGLLEKITDPRGASTRYEYNHHGLLNRVIDPAGRITGYFWNERAELVREVDHLGNSRHYEYNSWGRVAQVIAQAAGQALEHARQGATHYRYTPTGLVTAVSNAGGVLASMTYNENGQLTQYTDAQGRTTQYHYADKLSQPTERIDPAGQRIRYEYDTERNLTALINENGDKYQFFYDGNERLIREIGFDGREQQYKYNAAGHLIEHIDSGEVITEFERDALGQLNTKISRRVGDASDAQIERARYQYDPLGRLAETYNQHQYLGFEYDPLGNILRESHFDLNEKHERLLHSEETISHRYNTLGQRTFTQLPDGQSLQYDYDVSLGFRSVGINNRIVTTVQRDKLGREIARQQGELSTATEYDPQGRLSKQYASNAEQKYSPIQREYGYDASGNLNLFKDGSDETKYVYDTLNRIKLAANGSPEFFDFDPAGNLVSISNRPITTPGKVVGNRLLLQGDKKFDYDARGNLIRENRGKAGSLQTEFTYNLLNQLVRVDTNNLRETVQYKYDPLGRRIEKSDAFGDTRFIWCDNLLAQEIRNNIKKTYVYEPGSFRPLAQVQDDEIYHYHLDHLGTPRELTNEAGKIVWKAKYKTYGNLALKEVDEIENHLRFQGQYFDEETGLHYNRFRYYSPDTGQFINQDPIGLLGGLNNYQYAPNPIAWIDPLGLSCKEVDQIQKTVFAGHGSIDPNVQHVVPEGTSLTVYSWDGATITDDLGQAIEAGNVPSHVYRKKYTAGDTVPGYVLHANCGKLTIDPQSRQVAKDTPINELLKPNMGDTHWAACTYTYGHPNSNVIHDADGIFKKEGVKISKFDNGAWEEIT